jgi:rubrerythrin
LSDNSEDMLSQTPINLSKIKQNDIDKEALRLAIIAELDAISLYEQLASMVSKKDLKKVLLDVAREEKTHVGEFQALLLKYDKDQVKELENGRKEVEELSEQ